jgi:glyoxylate utilization-related uncharacterized protein
MVFDGAVLTTTTLMPVDDDETRGQHQRISWFHGRFYDVDDEERPETVTTTEKDRKQSAYSPNKIYKKQRPILTLFFYGID